MNERAAMFARVEEQSGHNDGYTRRLYRRQLNGCTLDNDHICVSPDCLNRECPIKEQQTGVQPNLAGEVK